MIDSQVVFPVKVRFEDGTTESYIDIQDIECNLEDFSSDTAKGCCAFDHFDRPLRLVVRLLELKELSLLMPSTQEK